MSSILALDPAHLKPGALTAHLGRVSLIEDVLWVRYPFTALSKIPSGLKEVTEHLNAALEDLQAAPTLDPALLDLTRSRLLYLNVSITYALDNYYGFDVSNRMKRGLIDGIGHLSRMLFGTAMNEDVEELRERYDQLSSIASLNNKAIELNYKNIARLDLHVQDLIIYTNALRSSLNRVLQQVTSLQGMLTLNQALSILEHTINSFLHTNLLFIQNLVDSARGRVTSSLFLVKDLLRTLYIGKKNFNLAPLFDSHSIEHYYPLLEPVLTSDAVVIHGPFQSWDAFKVHQIEPFPFDINGTIMILNLQPSVVLIANDFSLYAVGHLSDLLKCRTEYRHLYHFPAYLFAFSYLLQAEFVR